MRHYLTVEEVAEHLRMSARSVHELTRHASIPHRRVGRRCLFVPEELERWADGCELEVVAVDGRRAVRPVEEGRPGGARS